MSDIENDAAFLYMGSAVFYGGFGGAEWMPNSRYMERAWVIWKLALELVIPWMFRVRMSVETAIKRFGYMREALLI